ncbi:MAG: hypothetical protein JWO02_1245, partial [Solirubrobacterales bacterium]|nr:hypothetical protein [Solirubrobacterales bacterium]
PSLPPGIPNPNRSSAVANLRLAGALVKIAIPLAIFGAVGLTIFSVGSNVSHSVNDVRRAISTSIDSITVPAIPTPESPSSPRAPAVAPVGFGTGSLLLKSNFAKALTVLRGEGSRLRSLRVAPERIDASIVTSGGRMKQVQVTSQGKLQRFSTSGPGFSRAGTFPIDGLKRAAPFRLSRSAAGRSKRTASSVDYVVAITVGVGHAQGWTVILKNGGGQYLADANGKITRKIN